MLSPHRAPRCLTRLALGLSLVLALVCTGALGAHAAGRTAAPVTLKFASWDPAAVTDLFINPCAKQLNLHIINEYVPYAQYATKLSTEFAAGNAPDVFYGLEDHMLAWGAQGQLLDQRPWRKILHVPISNVLPQSQWWNHGNVGDKFLGQSIAVEDMFLFYNKNNFAQAGVAPPPSDAAHAWTWDQFVAAARKLTVDRHGKHPGQAGFDPRHIVRYGVNVGDSWLSLLPFVWSNGGDAYDAAYAHFTLDQPAASDIVQKVADLALKEHVAPTPIQMTSGAGSLTLASGRLAMEVSGNWDVYFQQYPKKTYPMGIGVLPVFKRYRTLIVGGAGTVWAHTKHPREAMELALCMVKDSLPLWRNGIWMPTIKSEYSESNLRTWATTSVHPSNYISVAVDTLKYAHDAPEIKTAQFTASWVDVIQPALDEVFTGHKSALNALVGIKSRVDAVLAQGR